MKGCFGTKEYSVKSRICKNCNVFADCEKVVKKNTNKFIFVQEEVMPAKKEALAKV